ncbi:MAG: translation initiation factor IF-1 [Candidatus Yonathbacteria bacterium RIFOXYC1_FULL_52_10]|uniref:Translation initiation factor IF-1 n=1 Tax=Candidatus Yonathbacteria bacterium RIFOXYD1_FULL_52_36 TaxID=1802730 RepID=A0A1G2SK23_9BACT|nr:MAG: translation initiation factor IF-1 [Candidatus Yonathbacteria bacterium RIFOXYC1_FULL_52_10]OHA85082.1 MAG: translation initiation factor IF-1 [Candidatus Yonathbacteria bacterium RIFOXYD1_FULL_52_36]
MPTEQEQIVEAEVIESLPNAMFRLELANGETLISFLAGKMRIHRIKVLVGDRVLVKLDPYGGKGRVVKRL